MERRIASWVGEGKYSPTYRWVSLDKIAPVMSAAVIASEDQNFADHFGFDLAAIQRALGHNTRLRQRLFLRLDDAKAHLHARPHFGRQLELADPLCDRLGNNCWRKFVVRRQDPVTLRNRPLTAVFFVELSDHARNALAGADP